LLNILTLETIDQYWSSFLGCDRKDFSARRTIVASNADNWHGILVFLRNELIAISVPENLLDMFRARAAGLSLPDTLKEERLRAFVALPIERVVGPAFVGYTDRAAFRPAPTKATRFLGQQDTTALAVLGEACSALEWEHGGTQLGEQPVVGAFGENRLVAVAGYELWGGAIAYISVIAHPNYRVRGNGTAVVSRLTAEALNRGLVPQYRTLANNSSMAIAERLGFERYATTVAVRLRLDAT
jgi:GNAT superfamily N-acetyltransferase